jgi:hypothetical protein
VPGPIELQESNGGAAYYLDGVALRVGEPIELMLDDGQWLSGIFEWSGHAIRWPGLRFKLGGDATPYAAANSRTAVVALPPDAVVRRVSQS